MSGLLVHLLSIPNDSIATGSTENIIDVVFRHIENTYFPRQSFN